MTIMEAAALKSSRRRPECGSACETDELDASASNGPSDLPHRLLETEHPSDGFPRILEPYALAVRHADVPDVHRQAAILSSVSG